MNRRIISIIVVLTVLMGMCAAFAQDGERSERGSRNASGQPEMRRPGERWQNMSEAERERFRAAMRERFGSRLPGFSREEQLNAVKKIEEQLAKLRSAIEATAPENRRSLRDLSDEERRALREKMMAAARDRRMAIRTIEEELARLSGPRRPEPNPREQIGELRAIRELAEKENATQTAERIEGLMMSIRREFTRRGPRPDRPPRPVLPETGDSANRAKPFTLKSFDGKTVSLEDYPGKTVVLEWLNYECPFVRYHYEKAGTMVKLARKYKDQGVVWLAINSTSHATPELNREFSAKHNLPYPILDDRAGTVGQAYGAKTTPHIFIISPRGNIVYNGAIDNSPLGKTTDGEKPVNYVDQTLAELIAGKDISVHETKPYGCSVKYAK